MGFLDVDKCKQALVANNGDIRAVIDELVGGVLGPGVSDACFLRLYLSRCSYLLYNICNGLIFSLIIFLNAQADQGDGCWNRLRGFGSFAVLPKDLDGM